MKYNDLTAKQKELLNAFIQGETLECLNSMNEWIPIGESYFNLTILNRPDVRIKPKEPVIKHTFSPVFIDGVHSYSTYGSIKDIWSVRNDVQIHSFLMKTYHDGKFFKAEIIPKLELDNDPEGFGISELKGLV